MRKCYTKLWLIFISIFLISNGCQTKKQSPLTQLRFSEKRIKSFNTYINKIQAVYPIPALGIALIKGDSVYYKASGTNQVNTKNAFKSTIPIFTGNLSEVMVATAIIKLVDEGKIALADPVVKHLPYFKLNSKNYLTITIQHLLTQTSGVPYHEPMWDLPEFGEKALESTTKSIALQQSSIQIPGSRVKRSPYNFDILADLIAKVSGKPFEIYVKENVFKPLNLQSSTFLKTELQTENIPQPHSVKNWLTYELAPDSLYPSNREHAGSIGWHASLQDLAGYMHFLLSQTQNILSSKNKEQLVKTHYKTGPGKAIGLGWEINVINEQTVLRKSHNLGGFSADLTLIPESKMGVVVISNIASDFRPNIINQQLLASLKGATLPAPKIPVNIPMGKVLAATNNVDSAFQKYIYLKQNYASQYDFSLPTLSQLGVNLLYRTKNLGQAIQVFQFCQSQYPQSALAQLNLAEAYLVNNQPEAAQIALDKVKKLTPDDPNIKPRLAYIQEALALKKEKA